MTLIPDVVLITPVLSLAAVLLGARPRTGVAAPPLSPSCLRRVAQLSTANLDEFPFCGVKMSSTRVGVKRKCRLDDKPIPNGLGGINGPARGKGLFPFPSFAK